VEILATISQVSQATAPFLLVMAVWAFATGKVVPRWVHDEAAKREQAWMTLYEREKATSERLIEEQERRRGQERPV
jgi:hypothetical protein